MTALRFGLLFAVLFAFGCGSEDVGAGSSDDETAGEEAALGEEVDPPFEVAGDATDLLLVWFDGEGPHTATSRADIPEAHRDRVRVDSLTLAPDDRPDPGYVFVADLREPKDDGSYRVRQVERDAFEALIEAAAPVVEATASAEVVIYGADWCGACRSTASYLNSRNVPFIERNVEQDPGARQEMQEKVRRAGLTASGIPVIDFRGTILTGFNRQRIDQLIQSGS
ncbi:MAG: glutaredoxin family protein [Myxococcota bacterium]